MPVPLDPCLVQDSGDNQGGVHNLEARSQCSSSLSCLYSQSHDHPNHFVCSAEVTSSEMYFDGVVAPGSDRGSHGGCLDFISVRSAAVSGQNEH